MNENADDVNVNIYTGMVGGEKRNVVAPHMSASRHVHGRVKFDPAKLSLLPRFPVPVNFCIVARSTGERMKFHSRFLKKPFKVLRSAANYKSHFHFCASEEIAKAVARLN